MSTESSNNLTLLWMQAQPVVEAYLNGLIRDRAKAEDVLQQVALTVTEKFDQFDASRSFTGWALGIARNKTLQLFERVKADRHRFSDELIEQLALTHEKLADETSARQSALDHCMALLPERSAALLQRRYVQNVKPGKIAADLGVSANSIRISLHRIRAALRKCIEQKLHDNKANA